MSETRYPVYVISKGRYENPTTAKFLLADRTPFHMVVEPQEADLYRHALGTDNILTLPFSNLGQGGIPARNWVWEHAKAAGHKRHWILDDNIWYVLRRFRGKRIKCDSGLGFSAVEEFVDRYENVAVAGLAYEAFVASHTKYPPFVTNCHVYSCLLILNELPQRWRGRYNEDTDLCLQVLSAGWCTVLFNAFMIGKQQTMTMKGGNSDELYKGDGRLKMSRALERQWPYVVSTRRRFDRPQHHVRDGWKMFDTPLKRREDIDWEALKKGGNNEMGMRLKQVKPVVKSPEVRALITEQEQASPK